MNKIFRRHNTLRVRFAVWTAGLLIATLLCFCVFVYLILAGELAQSIDDSLQLSAVQAITGAVDNGQLSISDSIPAPSAFTILHDRGYTIRILRSDGMMLRALGAYSDLPTSAIDINASQEYHGRFDTVIEPVQHEAVRFYTKLIIIDNQVVAIIQVAQSLDSLNDTLERLLMALLVSVPLLVAVAGIGGYLLTARALAPVDTMTRTAQRISFYHLHERLNLPTTNDEIGRLGATLDAMLDRLAASFHREHQFTADASHELRTPLTAMQTIIGVIRENPRSPQQYENALDDLARETSRLRELVENLLFLARQDEGFKLGLAKPVDLSLLLQDIVEVIYPLAQTKNLTLTCSIPDNISIMGSSDDLVRLFINLLDNAIKYTDAGGITLHIKQEKELIRVCISDTGIGIDPNCTVPIG